MLAVTAGQSSLPPQTTVDTSSKLGTGVVVGGMGQKKYSP